MRHFVDPRASIVRMARVGFAALLIVVSAGCTDNGPGPDIDAWLSCEECLDGELDSAAAHGDDALDPLFVTLYRGASAPQQQNYFAQANEEYRLARRSATATASVSVLSDSATMITAAVRALVTGRRMRAAWAIRAVGTPAARARLHDAVVFDSIGVTGWPPELSRLVELLDAQEPVTSVSITSPVSALAVGDSAQLSAMVVGPVAVSRQVVWSSSEPAALTVSASGLAKRTAVASATVRACAVAAPSVCARVVIGMP